MRGRELWLCGVLGLAGLGLGLGCGGAASGGDNGPDAQGEPGADAGPPTNPLEGVGEVELIQEGFMFLEGPQWSAATGTLLFSDIPANTIFELTPPSTVEPFRNPSGNSNGLAFDADGALLAAEHGGRRVSRTNAGGTLVGVATTFEGKKLNSPNDLVVRSDGTIYFTDPPYGIDAAARELDFMGVFRVPVAGALVAESRGALTARPNGIALSPAEHVLYVTDSQNGFIRAFDVAAGGELSGERMLVPDVGGPDGMTIDAAGNLFVSTSEGVAVFAPDGTLWGTIAVPRQPANCAFGDADRRTLYITAREGLYRVRLAHPGLY